jgi:imidazole glycerol-phosphate synthase subunit HisH
MNSIAIIDYGMGNLHSVASALEHVAPNAQVVVTADPKIIQEADRVVLPGVGAMRDCMAEMKRLGVDDIVANVSKDRPFLGICVGMQALMQRSEENGGVACLGLFDGDVNYFGSDLKEDGVRLKVPHMGWNQVRQHAHPMWADIEDNERFYFVHSYYVPSSIDQTLIAGQSRYGVDVVAALMNDNVFATQFHPEKSQHAGLQLLKNFSNWNGQV